MASAQHTTLRGWKEIASHVGRDVRTVQRWERQRGFPVKRLPGAERGNVYALASELDGWLHPSNKEYASVEVSPGAAAAPAEPLPVEQAAKVSSHESSQTVRFVSSRRVWRFAAAVTTLAAALALVSVVVSRIHQGGAQAGGFPTPTRTAALYTSPVDGVDALYLQSMYLFEKRTPEALNEAQRMLLDLTARDPKDALVWSGLAQTLTLRVEYGLEHEAGAKDRAREAAERALALDHGLAEPRAVLGFSDFFWKGDLRSAEPEFLSALRVNPASALAHSWYGTFLTYEARYHEALEQLNEAQHLEPSSTAILSNRALAMGLSGHREEAIQLLEQAGGDNPIASIRFHLATLALVKPRNPELFLQQEQQLAVLSHSDASFRLYATAQEAYRRGGEQAMWRSMLASGQREGAGPEFMSAVYAALGENDAAFQALAEAQRKSALLVYLPIDPRLTPLHRDPRFQRILDTEGLSPKS